MRRPAPQAGRRPAETRHAAAILCLALLAAGCAEGEGLIGGPAPQASGEAVVPGPTPDTPAEAPSESILGLDLSEIEAEIEAGTGRITLVRARPAAPPPAEQAGGEEALADQADDAAAEDARREGGRATPDPEAERELAATRRELGRGLETAGEVEAAVSEFEAALAAPWTGPTPETPWSDLARICRRGEPAAAVARACTVIMNPSRFSPSELAEFLANRGDANAQLGRTALAMTDYRGALEIESSNFRALVGRARLMLREGRPSAALNDLRLAISTGPRPAEARMVRASAFRALGELERAVADYDAILADEEARPWHTPASRGRAAAHCALGRPEAAAVDWQVWADSVPGGPVYVQELLRGRGYLKGPWEPGIGPATLAALRAWTREGCPSGRDGPRARSGAG